MPLYFDDNSIFLYRPTRHAFLDHHGDLTAEAVEWCATTGVRPAMSLRRIYTGDIVSMTLTFDREQEMMMFKLRWL